MILPCTPLVLRKLDATRNMARYYSIWLQDDLFGRPCVMTAWGRMGTVGRVRSVGFEDAEPARAAMDALLRQKLNSGYVLAGDRGRPACWTAVAR